MELIHFCSIPLAEGSIIQPGNWGRIMRLYPLPQNCNAELVRELLLEKARIQLFPHLPSRLECAYVCPTPQSAAAFSQQRPLDCSYKVELVKPDLAQFFGSWMHVNPQCNTSLKEWEKFAELYWEKDWRQESPDTLELITLSPLKIIERI